MSIVAKVVFTAEKYAELLESLCWDGKERACFLLCNSKNTGNCVKIYPKEILTPTEGDYEWRSAGGYSIKPKFNNYVFRYALDMKYDYVRCHIHPPHCSARFSPIDEHDEPIFFEHIHSKISGIRQGSLVFNTDFSELDGWFYNSEDSSLVRFDKIMVIHPDSLEVKKPTGSSSRPRQKTTAMHSRTCEAYGEEAVSKLQGMDFAVVGASGLGGTIIEMLARSGVRRITICDPDTIEESNLNRLVGATPSDIGTNKAHFYAGLAQRFNPEIEIIAMDSSCYAQEAQDVIAMADIVFGCVDSGARLSINQLCLANHTPYFDLGASIQKEKGEINFVGGQICSVIPGNSICLDCSGIFDGLKHEYCAPEDRELNRHAGYLKDIANPLVMHLDSAIASLGFDQMLNFVWGMKKNLHFMLHLDLFKNTLRATSMNHQGCLICNKKGFLGGGDHIGALAPLKSATEFPKALLEKADNSYADKKLTDNQA